MKKLQISLEQLEEPILAYLKRTQSYCRDQSTFDHQSFEKIFENLGTDKNKGLTLQRALVNQSVYGSNKLATKSRKSLFQILIQSLDDPMLKILIGAAFISIIVQAIYSQNKNTFWVEGTTILLAVFICSIVTTINNYEKQKQFQDLSMIVEKSNIYQVIRDSQIVEILRQDIVVGDLIKIKTGMEVPVDGIVVQANDLILNESSMTGETNQIYKNTIQQCQKHSKTDKLVPSPIIISGSEVCNGEGLMICLVVGKNSRHGKMNEMIMTEESEMKTPLQEKLQELAEKIGYFGLFSGLTLFFFLVMWLVIIDIIPKGWNTNVHFYEILKCLMLSVSIIVVAVPEGLPLAVTLSLAFSVKQMLKENSLVKRLACCETMGAVHIICTDKTGTLTYNELQVKQVWSGGELFQKQKIQMERTKINQVFQEFLYLNILSTSSATLNGNGSPTEKAISKFAQCICSQKILTNKQKLCRNDKFLKFPFSSARKRVSAGIQHNGKYYMFLSGAAQIVVQACQSYRGVFNNQYNKIQNLDNIKNVIKQMSQKGERVIALAMKEIDLYPISSQMLLCDKFNVRKIEKQGFTLLMIVGMSDKVRVQCKEAIKNCEKAGMKVIMVTGDNMNTSRSMAIQLNIIDQRSQKINQCISGEQISLLSQDLPIDQLDEKLKNLRVLSRCQPQDKYRLVQLLKKLNLVVAVTGDGTNDAPALMKADVGIALGKYGTQVAKNAADILILDDNFESIVRSIVWGRNVYQNIKKFLQFQLTVNAVACILSILSSAILRQSVFTTVQMLWLNLIMDSFASLALATQPPNAEQLLNDKPTNRDESLIDRTMLKHIIGQSVFQILIISFLLLKGQQFLPQYPDEFDIIIGTNLWAKYHNGQVQGTMISGLERPLFHSNSFLMSYEKYKVNSRHLTFIFNVFVLFQLFNCFNCRKVRDEINIFKGIFNNFVFWIIITVIAFTQWIIVSILSKPFNLYDFNGLSKQQWLISILIAFTTIPYSTLLKMPFFSVAQKPKIQETDKRQEKQRDQQ